MKNSRTSTNKKNIKSKNNIKKNSTRPASTKPKNIQKGKSKTSSAKKVVKNNKVPQNKKIVQQNIKKVQKIHKVPRPQNNRTSDNDIIRFNPEVERKYMDALKEDEKVNQKKTEKNIKKEENTRRIKPITVLKFFFFVAILISIGYIMFTFETFNLDNITVEGNEKYTSDEIANASTLKKGENVFMQLFKSKNINLSYISEHHYGYSFPSTITIKVKERYPLYIAKDKNTSKYYKLDNEGYILEECTIDSKDDELLVEGFSLEEQVIVGQKINDVYLHKLDIYNTIKKELQSHEIQGVITKVNFDNSLTRITLDDKLNVVFANDSNIAYKVSFLKGIIGQNGGIVEGTIDMSIDNPVYSKYD